MGGGGERGSQDGSVNRGGYDVCVVWSDVRWECVCVWVGGRGVRSESRM